MKFVWDTDCVKIGRPRKYPFYDMKRGAVELVAMPETAVSFRNFSVSVMSSVSRYARLSGKQFIVRSVIPEDGKPRAVAIKRVK